MPPYSDILAFLQTCEPFAIFLARLAVGTLFILSGDRKLFTPKGRGEIRAQMNEAGVPMPGFNAAFVPIVELTSGALLVVGLLTPIACVLLICVMLVAIITVKVKEIDADSAAAWMSSFLYLPEVLYVVILVWLFVSGPGLLSIDNVLFDFSSR